MADWASARSARRVAATSSVSGRQASTASASSPVPTIPTRCAPRGARWPAAIAAEAAAASRVSQSASITATTVPAAPNTVSSGSVGAARGAVGQHGRELLVPRHLGAHVRAVEQRDGRRVVGRPPQRVPDPLHGGGRLRRPIGRRSRSHEARVRCISPGDEYRLTVQVNLAVLCDAANVSREGKLNILGEFDSIHASSFPLTYPTMVLVLRMEAHPTEVGRPPPEAAAARRRRPGRRAAAARASSRPAFPPFAGVPVRTAPIILQMHGVRFDQPGHYSFELLVDGHHLRSLPLHFVAGLDGRARAARLRGV